MIELQRRTSEHTMAEVSVLSVWGQTAAVTSESLSSAKNTDMWRHSQSKGLSSQDGGVLSVIHLMILNLDKTHCP